MNIITSISIIFILGLTAGFLCKKLTLPPLIGYLLLGILIGPYSLNLIDSTTLNISSDIRRLALVVILTRAGLSLSISDLKQVGKPAVFMSFVPAVFEILGMTFISTKLLGLSIVEGLILGSCVAAVSPAVIVPSMLKIMESGYGSKKKIAQLIMAGASIDDIFVIVLFTSFLGVGEGGVFVASSLAEIPLSILLGFLLGVATGLVFTKIVSKFANIDMTKLIMVYISICTVFLIIEDYSVVSGLISIMTMGIVVNTKEKKLAETMATSFKSLWTLGELLLFVLVGATVNISYSLSLGMVSVAVICFAVFFRMFGVFAILSCTNFTFNEKLFCMIAYSPKATVQAAIGGLPLALGLSCGDIVLTISVVSILLTAPVGAFVIEHTYKKLLEA